MPFYCMLGTCFTGSETLCYRSSDLENRFLESVCRVSDPVFPQVHGPVLVTTEQSGGRCLVSPQISSSPFSRASKLCFSMILAMALLASFFDCPEMVNKH